MRGFGGEGGGGGCKKSYLIQGLLKLAPALEMLCVSTDFIAIFANIVLFGRIITLGLKNVRFLPLHIVDIS